MNQQDSELMEKIRQLIAHEEICTQQELVHHLANCGYRINQSKVSRLLVKLNVTKIKGSQGNVIYAINKEPTPPATTATPLSELIVDICCNEYLIVVYTSPGSASLIARLLDQPKKTSYIMGTIAGDDTIFVTPYSVSQIEECLREIKKLLFYS